MGKSTLDTRRGVRQYTLATGERDIGQEYFLSPAAMRKRTPHRRPESQRAKTFWSRIAPSVSSPGAPCSAGFCGSLFASTEGAAGVVLRAVGTAPSTHNDQQTGGAAVRRGIVEIVDH